MKKTSNFFTRFCRAKSAQQRGLTLVEIMVVLIILGLIMAWLGGRLFTAGDRAKRIMTQNKIKDLSFSIAQFQLQYNALPQSIDELIRCTERTGSACVPITNEDGIKDGWGNRFVYNLEEGGRRYRLKSYGADGKEGGEGVDSDPFGTGP